MPAKRPAPEPDRILVATLTATARYHVPRGWREPTEEQAEAAVTALRAITERPDLLAEVAGILLGANEGESYEAFDKIAAWYCIAAAADEQLILRWAEEGRQRRGQAGKPPPQHGHRDD